MGHCLGCTVFCICFTSYQLQQAVVMQWHFLRAPSPPRPALAPPPPGTAGQNDTHRGAGWLVERAGADGEASQGARPLPCSSSVSERPAVAPPWLPLPASRREEEGGTEVNEEALPPRPPSDGGRGPAVGRRDGCHSLVPSVCRILHVEGASVQKLRGGQVLGPPSSSGGGTGW
jgi:hypothetical protein